MSGFVDFLSATGYLLLVADVYAGYLLFKLSRGGSLSREAGAVPFGLGVASMGLALAMNILWPLPGPYNFVFGDPFLLFAALLLAAGIELLVFGNLKYIEGLAVPVGLIAILYGAVIAYNSLDPIFVWGMFMLEGLSGVVAGPAISNGKNKYLVWAALILLALASLLTAIVSVQTSFEHVHEFAKYFP
ncbi:MAG: DUF981 family protein [Thermoprotei archaeon]|jgi:putative membrane protein